VIHCSIEWNALFHSYSLPNSFLLSGRTTHSPHSPFYQARFLKGHTIFDVSSKHSLSPVSSDSIGIGVPLITLYGPRVSTFWSSTSPTSVLSFYLLLDSLPSPSHLSFRFPCPSVHLKHPFQDPLASLQNLLISNHLHSLPHSLHSLSTIPPSFPTTPRGICLPHSHDSSSSQSDPLIPWITTTTTHSLYYTIHLHQHCAIHLLQDLIINTLSLVYHSGREAFTRESHLH